MTVVPEVAALLPDIKTWRHHIHAHPETAFEETATSAYRRGQASLVRARRAHGTRENRRRRRAARAGPAREAIGLRADLDALHIHEKSGVAHASQGRGQDARVRPRRPHGDAAGRGRRARAKARLRRHGLLHLPAGRGERGRRPGDGRGRPLRALPDARRLRHAQLAAACRSARSRRASGR